MPDGKGLSNLGIGQQTQSSNAGGSLKDLLGSSGVMDEVGRSRMLSSQLDLVQRSQPRSPIDFLTSPRGLLALLGSVGAIAAGGQAQNVGIGALLGTLGQAQQVQEAERAQKDKATEELTKQWEKSQGRLDKLRTRMANIYNTNPEAFQGPDGSAPDPQVLGFLLTGEGNLPIWTSTRRNLNRNDKVWEAQTKLYTDALEEAPNEESARQLTELVLKQLGDPNPAPEKVSALVSAYGKPDGDFEEDLFKFYLKEYGMSGRDAITFAKSNGLSLTDTQVLRFLKKPEGTPAAEWTSNELERFKFIEGWETDPKNAQKVLSIRNGAKDSNEGQRLVNEAALASTDEYGGISAALVNKKLGIKELSFDEIQFQQLFRGVQGRDTEISALTKEKILDILDMTPEEFRAGQVETAQKEQAAIKENAQKSNAEWTAGQIDFIRSEISKLGIPGATLSLYASEADGILALAQENVGIRVGAKEQIPPDAKERLRVEIQRLVEAYKAAVQAQLDKRGQ